jgi:hypothetical protein
MSQLGKSFKKNSNSSLSDKEIDLLVTQCELSKQEILKIHAEFLVKFYQMK